LSHDRSTHPASRRRRSAEDISHAAPRITPGGYRSVEHFIDMVGERCGKRFGMRAELARYLNVPTKTVSKWLNREKTPAQASLDAIALWMQKK
jgi:transcriptional regulator with XRE-family HTH domain